uniref:NADH dehydrogenase subunit 6 n=1 Tax=Panagrolaimus sp. PS1159 TaxID=55785 RepID=A0AC35FKQ8_9BILA
MVSETGCCGMHIRTCAKIVSVVGILVSIGSAFSTLFMWYYSPVALLMLLTYIFVFIGTRKENPMPAEIILGINIAINFVIAIGFFVISLVAPQSIINKLVNKHTTQEDARKEFHVLYFLMAGVAAVASLYTIFAFTVIFKARKYFIKRAAKNYQASQRY